MPTLGLTAASLRPSNSLQYHHVELRVTLTSELALHLQSVARMAQAVVLAAYRAAKTQVYRSELSFEALSAGCYGRRSGASTSALQSGGGKTRSVSESARSSLLTGSTILSWPQRSLLLLTSQAKDEAPWRRYQAKSGFRQVENVRAAVRLSTEVCHSANSPLQELPLQLSQQTHISVFSQDQFQKPLS